MPSVVIDKFDDNTGWSSDAAVAVQEQEYEDFIAHDNAKSLMAVFDGNNGNYVEKSFNEDLSDYTELRFWFGSFYRGRGWSNDYKKVEDFSYKLDLGFKEYYLPAVDRFHYVDIKIPAGQTMTRFRITCLHDERDVVLFSHLIGITEHNMPLDILTAIQAEIEKHTTGINAGTVDATAGENTIEVSNEKFIDRYAKISFNGESHDIQDIQEGTPTIVTLGDQFDGNQVQSTVSGAQLTLEFPVSIQRRGKLYLANSITVYADPAPFTQEDNEESKLIDTFDVAGTVDVRKVGKTKTLPVQIDCESEHEILLTKLKSIVDKFFGRTFFWASGIKLEPEQAGEPTRVEAPQLHIIPKISYVLGVRFMEDIWERQTRPFPLPNNLTLTVEPKT